MPMNRQRPPMPYCRHPRFFLFLAPHFGHVFADAAISAWHAPHFTIFSLMSSLLLSCAVLFRTVTSLARVEFPVVRLFLANVGVHPRRTLCAVGVERIVRIFILAARLFHSQLHIVFSSAESGRISGQADLHIFYPNVSGEGREFTSVPLHHLVRILHSIASNLNIPGAVVPRTRIPISAVPSVRPSGNIK